MKLLTKIPLLVMLAVLTFSCSTDSIDEKVDAIVEASLIVPQAKPIEIETLELINNYRLSIGLSPLKDMSLIKSVAHDHTDYMIQNDVVSHDGFFNRSQYLKQNAGATKVSENIAYGYTTAQSVVNAWIKSEAHKANIEGDFTNFDLSAEKSEDGKWYYTNIFIKK